MRKLTFSKVQDNAIIPKKRDEDGAYDLFLGYYAEIPAGSLRCFKTGIASAFSKEYRIQLVERSSLAKKGLIVLGGLIDSGYRGEWRVVVHNSGKEDIIIPFGVAICQCKVEEVPLVDIQEVDFKDLLKISSIRGVAGFGSTDRGVNNND